jgi:hypothetical protein
MRSTRDGLPTICQRREEGYREFRQFAPAPPPPARQVTENPTFQAPVQRCIHRSFPTQKRYFQRKRSVSRSSRQGEGFIAVLAVSCMMNGTCEHVAHSMVVQRYTAIRICKHRIVFRA